MLSADDIPTGELEEIQPNETATDHSPVGKVVIEDDEEAPMATTTTTMQESNPPTPDEENPSSVADTEEANAATDVDDSETTNENPGKEGVAETDTKDDDPMREGPVASKEDPKDNDGSEKDGMEDGELTQRVAEHDSDTEKQDPARDASEVDAQKMDPAQDVVDTDTDTKIEDPRRESLETVTQIEDSIQDVAATDIEQDHAAQETAETDPGEDHAGQEVAETHLKQDDTTHIAENDSNCGGTNQTQTQQQQQEEASFSTKEDVDTNSVCSSASTVSSDNSTRSDSSRSSGGNGFCLFFDDFVDLQTKLVLMPYVEEEGKGAVVASYPEDGRFEGLVLEYLNGIEVLETADFTDLLAALREATTPMKLGFKPVRQEVETPLPVGGEEMKQNEVVGDDEDEASTMEDIDLSVIHEEKKEDGGDGSEMTKTHADLSSSSIATPKTENRRSVCAVDGDTNNKLIEPKNLFRTSSTETDKNIEASTTATPANAASSSSSAPSSYLEKRQSTPSKEHTKSINSALDHHHNEDSSAVGTNDSNKFSSGMFALSAWGMRMKAQSEKLLATTGEAIAAQQKRHHHHQQQKPSTSVLKSLKQQKQQQQCCDMYLQTNVGAYFPISKNTGQSSIKAQHLQAINTSSLFCIRKSATEACAIGRDTHNNVRYSFQWYQSLSTPKTKHNHRLLSNSYLADTDDSIGESSHSSRRTHSSTGSISSYSSSSSCSSSSSSSYTCSSFSMSTAGVTHHTISLASTANHTKATTTTRTNKDNNNNNIRWIPLKGATGPTFQPNTTLVGKKLRCIVTVRPILGTSQDETDDETNPSNADDSSSNDNANAIMDADDEINVNNLSLFGDDYEEHYDNEIRGNNTQEGVEKIVCDSVIPIQADMILFNGAKQAMRKQASAKFGNLLGRGGGEGCVNTTPATATLACGKTFRVEISAVRKFVSCDTNASNGNRQHGLPKHRRSVAMSSVKVYCRSSPGEEYLQLTDVPLLQVTARASPTNSRHVDLLFPDIPPPRTSEEGPSSTMTTLDFLSDFCVVDHPSCAETGGIHRLELEAPNRMTRESFLLALGIANYQGKASQLDNKKILYRDDVAFETNSLVSLRQKHTPPTTGSPLSIPNAQNEKTTSPKSLGSNNESGIDDSLVTISPGVGERRQPLSGNLMLSPTPASGVTGDTNQVLSPISCHSSLPDDNDSNSIPQGTDGIQQALAFPPVVDHSGRVRELQREMQMLRAQLSRKDKIVTELQRRVQSSERAHQQSMEALSNARQELKHSQEDCERILISKRHVERSMQSQHEATQKLETNHKVSMDSLQGELLRRSEKIVELEKLNRALQNEKAVLGATVEARESKLVKLEELQASNIELSEKVAQQEPLKLQVEESNRRYENLQRDFESKATAETKCREELDAALHTIQSMKIRIHTEQEKASSCQSQLEATQKTNQQLKGERNNFKKKNESLSKEVARLCRGGRSMRDIEKVLADHESLVQETELLRAQKRKALEEAQQYRISYEQAKAAEEMSTGMDNRETRRVLERTTELERLLSEMTDYVSAKEMQLDTMKQVNETLQKEIHNLAKANLRNDEV
ncbi:unnamed protein product [Pseudo-nitzschia multistriata]|uniref:Ig-like domain-containing protein n=1 Tax=Pseudo-nitzschia multistriata TaxID=183589 RepID=A0A448Z2J4_9STRA|nr:unnamed protein product [Pseudo-nitzschia multistriata]